MNLEDQTLAQLVRGVPGAAAVFERFHLDYSGHGQLSLREACAGADLDLRDVEESLRLARSQSAGPSPDWDAAPLPDLVAHIERAHHATTRALLDRGDQLLVEVLAAHAKAHPELRVLAHAWRSLGNELRPHLVKEESVLFPVIRAIVASVEAESPAPVLPFGTLENPVRMMDHEHDQAGELLRAIEAETRGFVAPPDASAAWRELYDAMRTLQEDLRLHIHLERDVLFPRAVAAEAALRGHRAKG